MEVIVILVPNVSVRQSKVSVRGVTLIKRDCANVQTNLQKQKKLLSASSNFNFAFVMSPKPYTPKAVVIDNHLPRQPLISCYVPD